MKVGVLQINGQADPSINIQKLESFLKDHDDLELLFFPEVFYSFSDHFKDSRYIVEHNSEHYLQIQALAKKFNTTFIGVGTAFRNSDPTSKLINRSYNFAANGDEISFYDKIHLFSVNSKDVTLDEAKTYSKGRDLVFFSYSDWTIGMSTCFDLRFPEMYRVLMSKGVNLFSAGSAFTYQTGQYHWEVLVRARAIENQSYVVAANQVGTHYGQRRSFGHSLIVDPWGDVLVNMKNDEGIAVGHLSLDRVNEIRSRMNVFPNEDFLIF